MTPLRQRMQDAMTVRGLAERTKECYVDAVARLARHYHRSPEQLSPPEIEAYLLHLVKDCKLSYSSVNHDASASRFLFETVQGGAPATLPNRKPIKGFAPCRVFVAVLRLALAGNNWPHGASPVAGKSNSQHRDWRN